MSDKTSVYIVSGYYMLRGMFCSLLGGEGGMAVLGEADNGETAYQDILRLRPQLVLLDIDLPELSGLELTERIIADLPLTLVIAITEKPEAAWLIEFLRLGGMGYLHDCRSEDDIFRAIAKVMSGNLHLEDAGVRLLADYVCKNNHFRDKAASSDDVSPQLLTERERQILHFSARGYNSVDISAMLLITVSTVGTYMRRIREKLHLEHKSELIDYAIRYKLYDDWK